MTAALPQDASSSMYVLRGPGWTAEVISTERILLHTAPDGGEGVEDAITAIIAPRRLANWTVEYSHIDSDDWDVWNLEREAEPSVTI